MYFLGAFTCLRVGIHVHVMSSSNDSTKFEVFFIFVHHRELTGFLTKILCRNTNDNFDKN